MDLLEAYAMRSPLESDDKGVGEPRVVEGAASGQTSGGTLVCMCVCVCICESGMRYAACCSPAAQMPSVQFLLANVKRTLRCSCVFSC